MTSGDTPDLSTTAGRLADLRDRYHEAVTAAGESAIAKQHAKGKGTARERIEQLLDENSFVEFDEFVRHRTTSFGHFTTTSAPAGSTDAIASRIAAPATSGNQPRSWSSRSARTSTLAASVSPAGAVQVRSSRPRPAVWCRVATTLPCCCSGAAASRSALVDPVSAGAVMVAPVDRTASLVAGNDGDGDVDMHANVRAGTVGVLQPAAWHPPVG